MAATLYKLDAHNDIDQVLSLDQWRKQCSSELAARLVCIATRTRSPASMLSCQKWRLVLCAPQAICAHKHILWRRDRGFSGHELIAFDGEETSAAFCKPATIHSTCGFNFKRNGFLINWEINKPSTVCFFFPLSYMLCSLRTAVCVDCRHSIVNV
jgi:hypothetical protein